MLAQIRIAVAALVVAVAVSASSPAAAVSVAGESYACTEVIAAAEEFVALAAVANDLYVSNAREGAKALIANCRMNIFRCLQNKNDVLGIAPVVPILWYRINLHPIAGDVWWSSDCKY